MSCRFVAIALLAGLCLTGDGLLAQEVTKENCTRRAQLCAAADDGRVRGERRVLRRYRRSRKWASCR